MCVINAISQDTRLTDVVDEKFYHILITFRDNSDVARQRSNRTFSNSIFETSLISDFFSTHITSN